MKCIAILFCLSIFTSLVDHADATSLKLETNRDRVYLGESFILTVTISGSGNLLDPDLSKISNAKIELVNSREMSQHKVTIVNGRMVQESSISRILSYSITPFSAGEIQAGPVNITVTGRTISKTGPIVYVQDIEPQDIVKVSVSSSHQTALVDEPFEITLTIIIKALENNTFSLQPLFPDNPPNVDVAYIRGQPIPGLSGPDINRMLNERLIARRDQAGIGINNITYRTDSFDFRSFSGLRGLFSEPKKAKFSLDPRIIKKNGESYFKYNLTLKFTPYEEGNYVFGPATFKGLVLTEIDDNGNFKSMDIFTVGHACTVSVTPPPEEGRPTTFTGAIGSNLTAQASLDTKTAHMGDPIKLNLKLSGDVRFNNMVPPKLSLQTNLLERFRIYDSMVDTVSIDDFSLQYIYTLRPVKSGNYDLPPIEISYYDTRDRKYQTIQTDPIPLKISESEKIMPSKFFLHTETDGPKPDELVPAPIYTGHTGAMPTSLIGDPSIIISAAAAGPALYFVTIIGQFIKARKKDWRELSRRQQVVPEFIDRIASAQAIGRRDASRACSETCAAVRQYLSDRLRRNAAALTPYDIRKELIAAGADEKSADKFCVLFEKIFNASFSNREQYENTNDICERLKKLIPEMERDISCKRKNQKQPD